MHFNDVFSSIRVEYSIALIGWVRNFKIEYLLSSLWINADSQMQPDRGWFGILNTFRSPAHLQANNHKFTKQIPLEWDEVG